MQGMGSLRLGSRAVMYTAETLPKGKNRVMGTIQIMTGFMHIGFGIVLTTLTNVYTSVFVIGEIPFLGGVSFIISGCLSIGAEKSPTECAVKGSQTMNIISAIFALLGIVAFIVDLNLNGLYRSSFDYYSYLVLLAGNGISIVLLTFTILEFCIAVATANFWCRATRLSSNEAMLIVPSATRGDLAVPPAELPQPPSYTEVTSDPKDPQNQLGSSIQPPHLWQPPKSDPEDGAGVLPPRSRNSQLAPRPQGYGILLPTLGHAGFRTSLWSGGRVAGSLDPPQRAGPSASAHVPLASVYLWNKRSGRAFVSSFLGISGISHRGSCKSAPPPAPPEEAHPTQATGVSGAHHPHLVLLGPA
ncbi:membrane-spanning 4-domains subfamily A member 4D-like [Rhynochetos jubatus]